MRIRDACWRENGESIASRWKALEGRVVRSLNDEEKEEGETVRVSERERDERAHKSERTLLFIQPPAPEPPNIMAAPSESRVVEGYQRELAIRRRGLSTKRQLLGSSQPSRIRTWSSKGRKSQFGGELVRSEWSLRGRKSRGDWVKDSGGGGGLRGGRTCEVAFLRLLWAKLRMELDEEVG